MTRHTGTWTLDDCPKPDYWDRLDPDQKQAWWIAVKSVADIEKVPVVEVATRPCSWDWSIYNDRRAEA